MAKAILRHQGHPWTARTYRTTASEHLGHPWTLGTSMCILIQIVQYYLETHLNILDFSGHPRQEPWKHPGIFGTALDIWDTYGYPRQEYLGHPLDIQDSLGKDICGHSKHHMEMCRNREKCKKSRDRHKI